MDVIPPEYDETTKERVYRQEWLEYFHYIGYDAAQRDFPAQYHALFPHGHYRPPARPAQTPSAGTSEPAETNAKAVEGRAASVVSSHSSAGSSVPPKAQESSHRVGESERVEGKDTRGDRERRPPQVSRREDRHAGRDRERRGDYSDDEKRHRNRRRSSDSPHRSHHHRSHHRSGRDEEHYPGASSGSRRRRRSDERDDRRGRYAYEESSRRSRREEESGTSRSRAYDDRREDALRRREANQRR